MKGLDELVAAVCRMDPALVKDVTEAMATNESFFFRDVKPFDQFRERVLPSLMAARKDRRQIRVWCAACSSGQEPYSLAIILKEMEAKLTGWRIDIVATDLSTEILEKAKAGLYSQFEVQRGMPIQLLVKYFQKKDETWQIDARLRAMVQYRPLNSLTDVRTTLGTFDVAFLHFWLMIHGRYRCSWGRSRGMGRTRGGACHEYQNLDSLRSPVPSGSDGRRS